MTRPREDFFTELNDLLVTLNRLILEASDRNEPAAAVHLSVAWSAVFDAERSK